jgi:Lrp/AsnC family leucine-responsive transcriptional regulator
MAAPPTSSWPTRSGCRPRRAGAGSARWKSPASSRGYSALVAREPAGFATSAILHVSLERHDVKFVDEFVARVTKRREVLECFATTGDADYHLRVVVRDMDAYNRFLDEFMFRIPGIRHVRTNVILKEIKTGVALPF